MIKKLVATRKRSSWVVAALVAGMCFWVACGPSAPFASYDPPPTFAMYLLLMGQTGLFYPAAAGTGSSLAGSHVVDIVGTSFVPTGWVYSFNPLWQDFKTYRTITSARWPAQWDITAITGCGAGSSTRVPIESKLPNIYCVPQVRGMNVTPPNYSTGSPPSVLTLYIYDTSPSTAVDVYIVDNYGSIYESQSGYVDSYGQVYIYNPSTPLDNTQWQRTSTRFLVDTRPPRDTSKFIIKV